ncbi:hypothetical protein [Dethiosulfatarculus sandiegensis]|uniref:Mor transcription activator domain-containing protein n=1 Tax=Dethiosulfatarculus sandiegensis TaxID=1429043 RepID=A0A0D2GJW6_9BACT|nr:hypothetical protein [Dethiosulfatarculus sandiegensis]KIX15027.1 hypothetical protein X474_05640 [Dethiosulfatarculus sandiegensis]
MAGSLLMELIALLGRDNALLLCEQIGGASYYIPAKPRHSHPFIPYIGMDGMEEISKRWGGIEISLPKAEAMRKRNAVSALNSRGLSSKEIALRAGCTERFVRKVRADLRRREHKKLPLFG